MPSFVTPLLALMVAEGEGSPGEEEGKKKKRGKGARRRPSREFSQSLRSLAYALAGRRRKIQGGKGERK